MRECTKTASALRTTYLLEAALMEADLTRPAAQSCEAKRDGASCIWGEMLALILKSEMVERQCQHSIFGGPGF